LKKKKQYKTKIGASKGFIPEMTIEDFLPCRNPVWLHIKLWST